jgi:2,4-dienoyl-CoA reductase-like NADH-dependent reductase (Old Yellow Enzyme family)
LAHEDQHAPAEILRSNGQVKETSMPTSRGYAHLLAAGRIGNLTLRNRILMSPMGSNLAEEDGSCGERIARYYEARAEGGAAMVIMGSVGIAYPRGSGNARQVAISEDKFIPGLSLVADAVHRHDAKIAVQLQHAGAVAVNEPPQGLPLLVPSKPKDKPYDWPADLTPEEMEEMFKPMYSPEAKIIYHEADENDIEWLIDCFAKAAVRARAAGIDGVEIHAGHGYIISSFLSPSSNHRSDRWGGTLENRARLLVEVIRRIKKEAGQDYPVWFRLDSQEYLKDDGITLEDAIEVAKMGEAAGADAIHVTTYADASKGISFTEAHTTYIPARYVPNASAIKAAVKVPVICPGRIEPDVGDRLIGEGRIDFVTMARKLLADPQLPNKLAAGRPDLVRPCIYCYTCISQIFVRQGVRCAVNVQTGHEIERSLVNAAVRKKVLIIGGGPGGMEAARVAALRGHDVSLYEAGPRLGGTVFFSSIVYPENGRLIEYLGAELRELRIPVHLNTRVTPVMVQRLQPDTVIVATGGSTQPGGRARSEPATRIQRRRDAGDGHRTDEPRPQAQTPRFSAHDGRQWPRNGLAQAGRDDPAPERVLAAAWEECGDLRWRPGGRRAGGVPGRTSSSGDSDRAWRDLRQGTHDGPALANHGYAEEARSAVSQVERAHADPVRPRHLPHGRGTVADAQGGHCDHGPGCRAQRRGVG